MSENPRFVPICKIDEELRVAWGPVLRPEIRDRHKTIVSAKVIQKAAHDFCGRLNKAKGGTRAGFMHQDFDRDLQIVETYLLPVEVTFALTQEQSEEHKALGFDVVVSKAEEGAETDEETITVTFPIGTWMIAMKFNDDDVWQGVKTGKIRGFSIGGRARIKYEE